MIDTATKQIVDTLPSGADPELFILAPERQPALHRQRGRQLVTVVDINAKKILAEVPVGVEPEGMGLSPDGKTLVNTSETTNMAHFIDTDHLQDDGQCAGRRRARASPSSPPTASSSGYRPKIGGTVCVIDPATRQVIKTDRASTIPGVHEGGHPAGRRARDEGRQARVRGAWPGEPRRGDQRQDLRGGEISCWSDSASGSSPSRRMKSCSSPPTATPTTSR